MHAGRRTVVKPRPRSLRAVTRHAATGAMLALAALTLTSAAPRFRPPRDPAMLAHLLADGPHVGECESCHTAHAADQSPVENLLLGPNDNTLCLNCHTPPWEGGSFLGPQLYAGSAHGSGPGTVWPGPEPPARIEIDAAGKCLNCHDPHGWTDASGLIPRLTLRREEALCLTCHDGSPAAVDVSSDLHKPYRHPVTDFTGRHTGPGEASSTDFATAPLPRRHAECEDCHDPHLSRAETPLGPVDDDASVTTLGASRVAVLNGMAGSAPAYTFVPGADTLSGARAEYELCFKCHSSWTSQPAGQTDLARALNPANPSYHPVEAAGRNPGIAPDAFVAGWSALSITRCGDCHGSDFGAVRGPHGSIYPAILRRPYSASPTPRAMTSDESCFSCHAFDVYANPAAPGMTREASRFNGPASTAGHAEHVGEHQVPCGACHVTHGSSTLPALLVTGRVPGILAFTATAGGGTCTPSCHGSQSYTVNYAR